MTRRSKEDVDELKKAAYERGVADMLAFWVDCAGLDNEPEDVQGLRDGFKEFMEKRANKKEG